MSLPWIPLRAAFHRPKHVLRSHRSLWTPLCPVVQASSARHASTSTCCAAPEWSPSQRSHSHTEDGRVPPLALVLDMDETLGHSAIHGGRNYRKLPKVDAHVEIEWGRNSAHTIGCDISWRPGLPEFLGWIRQRRDEGLIEGPWVFSAGKSEYVRAVLQELDPSGDLFGPRVLSQSDCVHTATPGFYLKDLNVVPSTGGLKRTVLIDNSPVSCILNPENSILIHDWLGEGTSDSELARVISVVEDAISNDVASTVCAAEGYTGFKNNLATLHNMIEEEEEPDDCYDCYECSKQRVKMLVPKIQAIKRDFLGPGPGCMM